MGKEIEGLRGGKKLQKVELGLCKFPYPPKQRVALLAKYFSFFLFLLLWMLPSLSPPKPRGTEEKSCFSSSVSILLFFLGNGEEGDTKGMNIHQASQGGNEARGKK